MWQMLDKQGLSYRLSLENLVKVNQCEKKKQVFLIKGAIDANIRSVIQK